MKMMSFSNDKSMPVSVMWFRRDLRLVDNIALNAALRSGSAVLPVFIFDKDIIGELDKGDKRITFIYNQVEEINSLLNDLGSYMEILHGRPLESFQSLAERYHIKAIYTNEDHEPYGLQRDSIISAWARDNNISFHSYNDHLIFRPDEILKDDGDPYTVFTPYKKRWIDTYSADVSPTIEEKSTDHIEPRPTSRMIDSTDLVPRNVNGGIPSLKSMGFERVEHAVPLREVSDELIKNYTETRDFPGIHGTSRLGVHLRFGTISIREVANRAYQLNHDFLSELIWREFYASVLYHFPRVVNHSFRAEYDNIKWRNNLADWERWCQGVTGYPLVDAGMRELLSTGYMHNRVRMVAASFLCKHLLIDWRWGEAFFAKHLLDYELSSNNGGWQWCAGTGTDAAPYFRIFNPEIQRKKFDPDGKYVSYWVPEYGSDDYPDPIVDHKMARERCLAVYKSALRLSSKKS